MTLRRLPCEFDSGRMFMGLCVMCAFFLAGNSVISDFSFFRLFSPGKIGTQDWVQWHQGAADDSSLAGGWGPHGDLEPYWQRWQFGKSPIDFFRKWPFIVGRYIIGDFLLPCLVMGGLMGGWDPNWVLPATRVCWNEGSITWHPVANGIPFALILRFTFWLWYPLSPESTSLLLYTFFLSQCTLKNLITCWF